jgi:hypothetical protein
MRMRLPNRFLLVALIGMTVGGISPTVVAQKSCGSPTQAYKFQMASDQQEVLLSKAASIPIGATVAQVEEALGRPDQDTKLVSKQGKFKVRLLYYYVARVDPRFSNVYDKFVAMRVDEKSSLIGVTYWCSKADAAN